MSQRVAWQAGYIVLGWKKGRWLVVWRKALEGEERSSAGSTMFTDGRDVVTVTAAAGLNQALVSQCLLVTLKDSPRKSRGKDLAEEESRV